MDIRIEGLTKTFGDYTAVQVDSMHIPSGESFGLIGNNGAGKTTLFRSLIDLIEPSTGSAFIGEFETNKTDRGANIITDDMHSRKKLMFVNSDAVVVLPGGAGSLDEFFEVLTWAQLGLHGKPIILANIEGYWTPLIALIDHVVSQGFASESVKNFFQVAETVQETVDLLRSA